MSEVLAKNPNNNGQEQVKCCTSSKVEADECNETESDSDYNVNVTKKLDKVPIESKVMVDGKEACTCHKTYNANNTNLTELLQGLINGENRHGNAKIKIEIEFSN